MAVVVLSTTSGSPQTWTVPKDCPVGTSIKVESWGAGSGGSGSSTSFRSGGAGGAYATAPSYIVTPHDIASGISFTLNTGSAGTGAANVTAGTDTSFSTNNLNVMPSTDISAAAPGTPGTLPTNWAVQAAAGLTVSVVRSGYSTAPASDGVVGLPYVDINFSGTTDTTGFITIAFGAGAITASVSWTQTFYAALVDGTTNNITDMEPQLATNIGTLAIDVAVPSTSTLTRYTNTVTTQVGATSGSNQGLFFVNNTSPVFATFRFAAPQLELGAAATFWKSTPGYCLAKGGAAHAGTAGGVGGLASACIPTTGAFNGGSGATRAQGGGAGGSAGPDGAGGSSTTGTGGTGDNTHGGAANTSNVLGGGGGTAANPANAGGAPGGGGGANTSTSNGAAGGRGQIRITYTPFAFLSWQAPPFDQARIPVGISPNAALAASSGANAWAFAITPPLFTYDWYGPLRDPYLTRRMPTAAVPAETHPVLPPPLGLIQWYAQLSTPPAYLKPNALPTAVSSPSFFPGFLPIVPAAPSFAYYTPFGNPPPPLPKRAVYMPPATGPPPNYAFDRWFQEALSTPPAHLIRPSLNTAIQQNHVEPITAALPTSPLISNIHPGLAAWSPGTYTLGQRFSSGGQAYQCIQAGNSTLAPIGNGPFIQMQPGSGFSSGFSSGWGNPADGAAFKWLSAIDYTSLQAWSNDLMTLYTGTGLPAPVTALVWNDSVLTSPLNGIHFFITGIPNNGVPALITCAPGESFRDSSGNPLRFDATKGVAFDAPTVGAELNATPLFFIDAANFTIDGLQFRDLNQTGNSATSGNNANILVCLGGTAANFTIQNCILDGFHLCYFNEASSWLKNCVLINEQTQQATSGSPLWPVKWDTLATSGGAINCTGVGFNPSGTCSMFTTLGGVGQATLINTCVFGIPFPFFVQNTGGSLSADHCATDQSTISSNFPVNDLGGNILNLSAANQFINTVNDFRLRPISGLIDRARADLTDLPSQQDIYRTARPQGLGWDIGAVEFVFSLTWLSSLSQPVPRAADRCIGLAQEPPFISIQRAEVTSIDRYYQPLSRLIPPRQGLAAHLQQALIQPVTTATTEATTVTRWLATYPAIVPGRTVHPSLMPSHVEPVSPIFIQDVTRFRWAPTYPDLVSRQRLHPSQVPFRTFQPTSLVFREATTLDRWYQSLSVPQLWRVYYREQAPPTEPFVPTKIIAVAVTVSPSAGSVIVTGYGPLIKRLPGSS